MAKLNLNIPIELKDPSEIPGLQAAIAVAQSAQIATSDAVTPFANLSLYDAAKYQKIEVDKPGNYAPLLPAGATFVTGQSAADFNVTAEVLADNEVYFYHNDANVWGALINEMPRGANGKTIETFNPTKIGGYVSGSQIFFEGKIYEVVSNALIGENPKTNPEKFKVLLGSQSSVNYTNIFSSTGGVFSNIDVDSSGNIYIIVLHSTGLRVYENGVLKITHPVDNSYMNGISGISFKKLGTKLEILVNTFLASQSTNGVLWVTYDISANTVTKNSIVTTEANEKLNAYNIIEKSGVLYTALNVDGVVVAGALNTANTNKRIDLFKFESGAWSKVNTISVYNEIWGARFTKTNNVTDDSLRGTAVSPRNGILFLDPNNDIGIRFTSNNGPYNNRVFLKLYKSGEWVNKYIEPVYKSFITYTYLNNQNQERLIHKRYTNPTFTWSLSRTEITKPIGSVGFVIGKEADEIMHGCIYVNGNLYALIRTVVGVANTVKLAVIPEYKIQDNIEPKPSGNFKGILKPTDIVNTSNLSIGDYYELSDAGTYTISSGFTMDLSVVYPTYIKNYLGEKTQAIWNGNTFYINRLYNQHLDLNSNIPLEGIAIFNVFNSDAFRIPTLLQARDKSLIMMADARLTTVSDYAEMDVVITKSYDNGATWTDYQTVFERTQKNIGWRVHDGAMVLDNNPNSPQYGRIWAFAKEWQANVDPADRAYWDANSDKLKIFMRYSDDNGITWSAKTEFAAGYVGGFLGWSTGCATGITLSNGTLVLPMYWNNSVTNSAGFIYKTVGGNWQVGDIVEGVFTNENQIMQDVDGKLIMNARSTGGVRKVLSLDSIGSGWIERPDLEVLEDVNGGCQASFVRYRNTYLFSQPTTYGSATRSNIKVFYSYDLINWQELVQLTYSSSQGYSELEVTDTTFGVAVETTASTSIHSITYFDLSYLRWLLK